MTPLESALVEQVKALDEVNRLSRLIGTEIARSYDAQAVPYGKEPTDWLKLAYERDYESDGSYGRQYFYVNHEEDVEGYLAENCRYALQAHLLIQERKEARRLLGIARRRVSFMGRNLLKKEDQHDR